MGLSSAASADACACTPPIACSAVADSPYGAAGSAKTLRPSPSTQEMWAWKPEPPSSLNGLAMKVAIRPSCRASSLTADLKRKARSAASVASEWFRLISNCPPEYSWLPIVTPMSSLRSVRRLRSTWEPRSPLRPVT